MLTIKTNPLAYAIEEKKEKEQGKDENKEIKKPFPAARTFEELPISRFTKKGI